MGHLFRTRISKDFRFEAAHRLPYHDGPCANLHGHSYVLRVIVEGSPQAASEEDGYVEGLDPFPKSPNPQTGMVLDYGRISKAVKPIVAALDHHMLNEIPGLENPTAEILCEWIYDQLHGTIPGLVAIGIKETESSYCEYEG